jgi:hypothetical protein
LASTTQSLLKLREKFALAGDWSRRKTQDRGLVFVFVRVD